MLQDLDVGRSLSRRHVENLWKPVGRGAVAPLLHAHDRLSVNFRSFEPSHCATDGAHTDFAADAFAHYFRGPKANAQLAMDVLEQERTNIQRSPRRTEVSDGFQ